jgi:transcriptional regulator GlxA family with amidase domain
MKFGVFIYPGVEPIDLATIGVLSMARRIAPEISIAVIGPTVGPIEFSNGLVVMAQFDPGSAPETDVLIVTGGPGWKQQAEDSRTLDFLRRRRQSGLLAGVCTGGMILAASGVLDGLTATTKREVVAPEHSPLEVLKVSYPAVDARAASFVDAGPVVTSGGVSLCIDATLYILERCLGKHVAEETARTMEYTRALDANRRLFPPVLLNPANA